MGRLRVHAPGARACADHMAMRTVVGAQRCVMLKVQCTAVSCAPPPWMVGAIGYWQIVLSSSVIFARWGPLAGQGHRYAFAHAAGGLRAARSPPQSIHLHLESGDPSACFMPPPAGAEMTMHACMGLTNDASGIMCMQQQQQQQQPVASIKNLAWYAASH